MTCQLCNQPKDCISSLTQGKYYASICRPCLSSLQGDSTFSSGYQSFTRRRGYEDMAQDTVQPYDAAGKPRSEFYRLYPSQVAKIFSKDEISEVKRKL